MNGDITIVAGTYPNPIEVGPVVEELHSCGFDTRAISVLLPRSPTRKPGPFATLLGANAVDTPVIGRLVAAAMAAAASGDLSVSGTVMFWLIALRSGDLINPATIGYAEHLNRGSALLTVFCTGNERVRQAQTILRNTGAQQIDPPESVQVLTAFPVAVSPDSGDPGSLLSLEFPIPFDKIRAANVQPAVALLLSDACAGVEAIADVQEPPSFDNTLRALDKLTEPLDRTMAVVRHLESVATYPELRGAYNEVQPKASAFYSGISANEGLSKVIQRFAASEDARALQGTPRRFLAKTISSFKRQGVGIDPAGRERLKEIEATLTELTTKFAENVLDVTNAWDLVITDEAALKGLHPSAIAAARASFEAKTVDSKGSIGWRFTLQAPSYMAAMTYLDDAGIREQMWRAYYNRGAAGQYDNRELIVKILELRGEQAKLLGYRDFAELILQDRMVQNGNRAMSFVEDLKAKTMRRFSEENRELTDFRRSIESAGAPEIEPWDVAYYAEKQRAALFDFDEETLRPYFPMDRVVAGLFALLNRLYGIRIVERPGVPVWDSEVVFYDVLDEDETFLGGFYADWYPRENKRGGAWMDSLIVGGPSGDRFRPHVVVACANLTPSIGGKPALLTHREVETVFHIVGYAMHQLLSEVEIRSLAGTSVAWDFVSLPSQIMENWCWERQMLDLFARHWETGAPIPEDLFLRMKRAHTFRSANAQMKQLGFGLVDLMLHQSYSPSRDGDPVEYTKRILQDVSPTRLPSGYAMITAFTHLFASPVGYSAGYYSYKWTEMLDADAFTKFRDNGLFSREVGKRFRETILAKGDSEDPGELFRKFMGRDPNPKALLERLGLT